MRHDWKDYVDPTKSPAQNCISEPMRRCANCGAIQGRERVAWYMRTTGYLWRPLAGRCSPQPSFEAGMKGKS